MQLVLFIDTIVSVMMLQGHQDTLQKEENLHWLVGTMLMHASQPCDLLL